MPTSHSATHAFPRLSDAVEPVAVTVAVLNHLFALLFGSLDGWQGSRIITIA